jgi:hypothetical protein
MRSSGKLALGASLRVGLPLAMRCTKPPMVPIQSEWSRPPAPIANTLSTGRPPTLLALPYLSHCPLITSLTKPLAVPTHNVASAPNANERMSLSDNSP